MNAYEEARFYSDMSRIRKTKPKVVEAYLALGEADKREIRALSGALVTRVKGMGTDGALELLAKIGILFLRGGRN